MSLAVFAQNMLSHCVEKQYLHSSVKDERYTLGYGSCKVTNRLVRHNLNGIAYRGRVVIVKGMAKSEIAPPLPLHNPHTCSVVPRGALRSHGAHRSHWSCRTPVPCRNARRQGDLVCQRSCLQVGLNCLLVSELRVPLFLHT